MRSSNSWAHMQLLTFQCTRKRTLGCISIKFLALFFFLTNIWSGSLYFGKICSLFFFPLYFPFQKNVFSFRWIVWLIRAAKQGELVLTLWIKKRATSESQIGCASLLHPLLRLMWVKLGDSHTALHCVRENMRNLPNICNSSGLHSLLRDCI